MSKGDDDIDWSKTSFEGSRREQLRRSCLLTLRQRLEALDRMTDLAERMANNAAQRGADVGPAGQASQEIARDGQAVETNQVAAGRDGFGHE